VNILILHQHFNTPREGGPLRSYYLAAALVASGMRPIVITAHNNDKARTEEAEGMEIHYLPVPYDNQYGFWERSISFLRYSWGAFRLARKFRDTAKCYAISAPLTVGFAAKVIQFWYGIPFIFEVGDLWPEAPIQLGIVKNPFLKYLLFRLEKSIYYGAESIVALSTAIQSDIEGRVPGKTVHLIQNMADTEFYQPADKDPRLEEKYDVANTFVISYVGAVGLANGLEYFVACAHESLTANLPIRFLMCGHGAMLPGLRQLVNELQLNNFSILPFQNRAGVKDIMNVTDAAFVCYKPVPILETGSPNKYFDGLAGGKLIICNFGGWIEQEMTKQECGFSVDPHDPRDFINKIEPFLRDRQRLKRFQHNSRQLAQARYSRAQLSAKFVELFN